MDRQNALTLPAIAIAAPRAKEAALAEAEKERAVQTLTVGTVALETAKIGE